MFNAFKRILGGSKQSCCDVKITELKTEGIDLDKKPEGKKKGCCSTRTSKD